MVRLGGAEVREERLGQWIGTAFEKRTESTNHGVCDFFCPARVDDVREPRTEGGVERLEREFFELKTVDQPFPVQEGSPLHMTDRSVS